MDRRPIWSGHLRTAVASVKSYRSWDLTLALVVIQAIELIRRTP
jgi:hypothetical protein